MAHSPAAKKCKVVTCGEVRATLEEEAGSVLSRRGSILSRGRILKADHFPSCRNQRLPLQLQSAPNIRRVSDRNIYGVGQPTSAGISDVLGQVPQKSVVWVNMREEPFLFIKGKPYCVKDWKRPFDNIERTGISIEQVESDEELLRLEILEEAKRYGGRILLHGEMIPEGDDSVAAMGEVYCFWQKIDETSVVCYHSVCDELSQSNVRGKDVHFYRVPVTDEHSLQEKDFDRLHSIFASAPDGAALIFNCQMGRGRATTGMVVAAMLWEVLGHSAPRGIHTAMTLSGSGQQFAAVHELQGLLSGSVSSIETVHSVDTCIEMCVHMQNIRDAVVERRDKAQKYAVKGQQKKEAKELGVARHYLERYMFLVLYQAYVLEQGMVETDPQTFTDWMEVHPNRNAIYCLIDGLSLEDHIGRWRSDSNVSSASTYLGSDSDSSTK